MRCAANFTAYNGNPAVIKKKDSDIFYNNGFDYLYHKIPYYIILLTINICYEKNSVIHVACCGNAAWQLCTAEAYI